MTEAPRVILERLGLTLVEMPRNRANSFCCGAGGSRIWMTDAGTAERPSEQRIREATEIAGVKFFVAACPKDVTMFREAVTSTRNDARIQVKDLIEFVEQATGSDDSEKQDIFSLDRRVDAATRPYQSGQGSGLHSVQKS